MTKTLPTKGRGKPPRCRIVIEVQRTQLQLVVAEYQEGRVAGVRGRQLQWLREGESLHADNGLRELTATLKAAVADEKVAGANAHLLLSSDLCVTRVAVGDNESLRSEIRDVRDRSSQYLLLGTGTKAVAESTLATDAKHARTWLSVTNTRTLDCVVRAAEQAGLAVRLVEHSLVALCRSIGRLGLDETRPVITIDVNEHGVDLGVSHQGKLLFSYRPGGLESKRHIAEIVDRHLERIRRFCHRQFRGVGSEIEEVFLHGPSAEVKHLRGQFEQSALRASVLEPVGLCRLSDDGSSIDSRFAAALGSLLVDERQLRLPAAERGFPNLLDSYHNASNQPVLAATVKALWPVAATLFLAIALRGLAMYETRRAARVEARQAELDEDHAMIRTLLLDERAAAQRIESLRCIARGVERTPCHRLMATIGRCMPEALWLQAVNIAQAGEVQLQGLSHSQDLIFRFIADLKQTPLFAEVSLLGQEPIHLSDGPGVRFEVKCRYVEANDPVERTARDD